MTDISKRQHACSDISKKRNNWETIFIYKRQDTLQKSRQCPLCFIFKKVRYFTIRDFDGNFEVGDYIPKAWHFALRDVFILKKPDTSQKVRQFALRFNIQNPDILRYGISHWNFEIGGGGGDGYICKKQYTLRYIL